MPECVQCGYLNDGGGPFDPGCRRCGYDPTDEQQGADREDAADHARRREVEMRGE